MAHEVEQLIIEFEVDRHGKILTARLKGASDVVGGASGNEQR
jgi:hypothetical protein